MFLRIWWIVLYLLADSDSSVLDLCLSEKQKRKPAPFPLSVQFGSAARQLQLLSGTAQKFDNLHSGFSACFGEKLDLAFPTRMGIVFKNMHMSIKRIHEA